MEVSVSYKAGKGGGERTTTLTLPATARVADLLSALQQRFGVEPARQALKPAEAAVLADKAKGSSAEARPFGLAHAAQPLASFLPTSRALELKRLPPQISYRLVFVVEYTLPLLAVLFFAAQPSFVYGADAAAAGLSADGQLAVLLWTLHYGKRLAETLWLHKFSRPTMPFTNLYKNAGYYFAAGLGVGYTVASPGFTGSTGALRTAGILLFVAGELVNFAVHVHLASLPSETDRSRRQPPRGPLFALVTSPNYTAEVVAWLGFAALCGLSVAPLLFVAAGAAQMAVWAKQKHSGYKQSNPEYARARAAIFPFVL